MEVNRKRPNDESETANKKIKVHHLYEFPKIRPVERCESVEGFEQLNTIEEGTYGIVSRARNRVTGEIVALKRLKRDKNTASEGFPITSLREIKALKALRDHPNIVQLLQVVVGSRPSDVYLVMEFVEHDLYTLMERIEPFVMSEVKTLMIQVLSATKEMHRHGIFHRDLKTANLLVTNRGQIKIADFGLSAEFNTGFRSTFTHTVVTVRYRAPEVFLSRGDYNQAIDIWAIGCIFAELLNHRPFFQGTKDIEVLNEIFRKVAVPDEDTWPGFRRLADSHLIRVPESQPRKPLYQQISRGSELTADLLSQLLALDPDKRISAASALCHPFFEEAPLPKHPDMFPSFPSRGGME